MNRRALVASLAVLALLAAPLGHAATEKKKSGPANVVGAAVTRNLDGTFDLRITVRSADKGPEYYCDRIEIVDPEGKLLHTHRVAKPHPNEQPFSETLRNLRLPAELEQVTLRARMLPDKTTGKDRTLKLPPLKKK